MTDSFWTENPARIEIANSFQNFLEGISTMSHKHNIRRPGKHQIDWPSDWSDPNGWHWLNRRDEAMNVILQHPEMEQVWDSSLVPDNAFVMVHALLAEKIVSGELHTESLPAAR